MGSACCVAARDRTITNGSINDAMPRNIRYSPSWSVRWDNRGRVAGEEASMSWLSDRVGTNDRLDNKSQTTVGTAYASEEGSPIESFRNLTWNKLSPSEGRTVRQTEPSPTNRGSHDGSSDGFFVPAFNELMATSHRDRWSFDSEYLNFDRDKLSRYSGQASSSFSTSIDMQTCGVCSKLLTERSSRGTQKIIASNELAVVSILICGHVYHSECLENMTSEINKFDPPCPVCTFGEKKLLKISEKVTKADFELKVKMNKKSRSRVVDGNMNGDDVLFDRYKSNGGNSLLKRHFSLGSKGSRLTENNYFRKKGFFWPKSSRV